MAPCEHVKARNLLQVRNQRHPHLSTPLGPNNQNNDDLVELTGRARYILASYATTTHQKLQEHMLVTGKR
jgi:hypothetical protein